MRRFLHLLPLAVLSLALTGCPSWFSDDEEEKEPFFLGDLIEEFSPPTLEELDAKVEWVEKPVLDSMELLREFKKGETVLATEEEALALANDSPQANAKIVSGLGRLAESDGEVDWNASITRHIGGDVKSTNPLFISSTAEFDVAGLTGVGLFGFDWNFDNFASKDTVISWHSSKDGLYDKIVMRDDLTWSDGKPVTAHDIVFSFKVIMSNQVSVPAVKSGTEEIRWIEAYDDHTLVFFHKEPLVTNTANMNFPIIPKHVYEESIYDDPSLTKSAYHEQRDEHPVVGGTYTITKRERGSQIVLTRRESWYMHDGKQVREKPYFKIIRFRVITDSSVALLALKSRDIEEMLLTPEQWRTQTNGADFYKNNTKEYGLEWTYFYFGWNTKKVYFTDKRVRQAMGYAFDHEEMLSKLRYGLDVPCNGIYHKTSKWSPKNPPKAYTRDITKAEALLDDAGWIDHDNDGIRDKEIDGKYVPFEFTILVSQRQDRIDICALLKENLSQIGIICKVKPTEFTVLQQLSRDHKFQAMFAGWGTGTDPDTSVNLWVTGKGRNYGEYSNAEVDKLFEQGKREFDPEKRAAIYAKIHTTLYEDQPYTWLFFRNGYYGFNKRLRGYKFSPRGPYNYGPGFNAIWKPAMK
ncbi:MAG: peptide-binding protein [Planctomycetes bacterium]|nr:peptide-binding protein [Planctomycetota bacterium]